MAVRFVPIMKPATFICQSSSQLILYNYSYNTYIEVKCWFKGPSA